MTNRNFTSMYIPIETFDKLKKLGKQIEEIIDKPVPPYKVIEILMALQLQDHLL